MEVFGAEPELLSPLASQVICDDTVMIDKSVFAGTGSKVYPNSEKPSLKPKPSILTNENLLSQKSNLFLDDIHTNEHPLITKLFKKAERSRFDDTQNIANSEDCQLIDDKIHVKNIMTSHLRGDDDMQFNFLSTCHPSENPRKPPLIHNMSSASSGSDVKFKFVPSRRAPFRPPSLTSDLIQFSPEHGRDVYFFLFDNVVVGLICIPHVTLQIRI